MTTKVVAPPLAVQIRLQPAPKRAVRFVVQRSVLMSVLPARTAMMVEDPVRRAAHPVLLLKAAAHAPAVEMAEAAHAVLQVAVTIAPAVVVAGVAVVNTAS
jgi:hypothetical protein